MEYLNTTIDFWKHADSRHWVMLLAISATIWASGRLLVMDLGKKKKKKPSHEGRDMGHSSMPDYANVYGENRFR